MVRIGIARREGRQLPPGAILNKASQPSTDPDDWASGGPMLPAGGYKGYALPLLTATPALLRAVREGFEEAGIEVTPPARRK